MQFDNNSNLSNLSYIEQLFTEFIVLKICELSNLTQNRTFTYAIYFEFNDNIAL